MSKSFIFLIILCLASKVIAAQCNNTHLEFFSEFTLGKLEELNRTFTAMEPKINVKDVTWKKNDTATYTISEVKTTFFFRDSKQKAEIMGNDQVLVSGGDLVVRLDFNWKKTGSGSLSGNGSAMGDSNMIEFTYNFTTDDQGFLIKELVDAGNVTISHNGFGLVRVSPPEATDEDRDNIKKLLNDIINVTTVRHEVEDQIENYFYFYLNQVLNNDKTKIDAHFVYEYKRDLQTLKVEFDFEPTDADIEKEGIDLYYMAKIKDYSNWTCTSHAPTLHWNPKVYGGLQELVTYDIYRNTLNYAIDQKFLNVDLNRANQESRFFQFYAGDLYEVIPKVATKYLATDKVTGSCQTSSKTSNVGRFGQSKHEINANLTYQCQLSISQQKVTEFEVQLSLAIEGRPNNTHLDFVVISFSHKTQLVPYLDYKIENKALAEHMITHSLNRLLGHKVLGSGWEFYPRDYPHFQVQDNYTILYDSTHVESRSPDASSLELQAEQLIV